MHKSFLPLFLISLIGVLGSSFIDHEENSQYQFIGLIAGVLPLLGYYFALAKKKLLSQSEIDSIYYFGFLVTVITLVSTAIAIGIATKLPKLNWILLQFGLGLIATGIALFARLMLMTKSTSEVELDVVESSKLLVAAVTNVSGEFDNASYLVKSFVDQLQIRMNDMVRATEEEFKDALKNSLDAYVLNVQTTTEVALTNCADAIDKAAKNFSIGISLVIKEVERIKTEAEGVNFAAAAVQIEAFSLQIQSSLQSITDKTSEVSIVSATGIAELGATTRKVQKLAIDIASKLEKIDQIQNLLENILNTTEALGVLKEATNTASSAITKLNATSSEAAKTIDKQIIEPLAKSGIQSGIEQLNIQFPEKIEAFGISIDKLNLQAIELMTAVATSRTQIERTLGNLAQANLTNSNFSELDKTAQILNVGLTDLVSTTNALSRTQIERTLGNVAQANLTNTNFSELDKTAQILNAELTDLVSTANALKRSMESAKFNASMLIPDPAQEPSPKNG